MPRPEFQLILLVTYRMLVPNNLVSTRSIADNERMAVDLAGRALFLAIPAADHQSAEQRMSTGLFPLGNLETYRELQQALRLAMRWSAGARDPMRPFGGTEEEVRFAVSNSDFRAQLFGELVEAADPDLIKAVLASLARGFAEGNLSAQMILGTLVPALGARWTEVAASFVKQLSGQRA